jgi:hypothetical protein
MTPVFWVDASVLIQAERKYYPFKRVPQFWAFIDQQLQSGNIRMPRLAYEEVASFGDDLSDWCKARKAKGLCVRASKDVQQRCLAKVIDYVYSNHPPHQAAEFLKGADSWLIAHALCEGGTVVTEETRGVKMKVKIPTVTKTLGGAWCDTSDMLNSLDARFG